MREQKCKDGGLLSRTGTEPDEDSTLVQPFNAQFDTCKGLDNSRSKNIECSGVQPAVNYSLQIDAKTDQFLPNEDITVKVSMTNCPLPKSPGTEWYTIELFYKDNNASNSDEGKINDELKENEGKLRARFKSKDVYHCNDDKGIVFHPCEPSPFNFPGKYVWTAPTHQLIGSVCFRLTAVQEGSTVCEVIEKCIEPATPSIGATPFNEAEYYDDYSNTFGSGEEFEEGQKINHETFDLSDEESSSRTDEQAPPPTCKQDRNFYEQYDLPWKPDCDCQGYYSSVQCSDQSNKLNDNSVYCWCSTALGFEVTGTRIKMDCDVANFELSCLVNAG